MYVVARLKGVDNTPIQRRTRKARVIYLCAFLSAKYAFAGRNINRIFEPSSGGTGIRLKTAIEIFRLINIIRKRYTA